MTGVISAPLWYTSWGNGKEVGEEREFNDSGRLHAAQDVRLLRRSRERECAYIIIAIRAPRAHRSGAWKYEIRKARCLLHNVGHGTWDQIQEGTAEVARKIMVKM